MTSPNKHLICKPILYDKYIDKIDKIENCDTFVTPVVAVGKQYNYWTGWFEEQTKPTTYIH